MNSINIINTTKNSFDKIIINQIKLKNKNLKIIDNFSYEFNYKEEAYIFIIDLDKLTDLELLNTKIKDNTFNKDNLIGLICFCDKYCDQLNFLSNKENVIIIERSSNESVIINNILNFINYIVQIGLKKYEFPKVITMLMRLLEIKYGYIENHNINVSRITKELLTELNRNNIYKVSPIDISLISEAAIFHDLGKVKIDERILNKPSKLSKKEFSEIKKHTIHGANIIKDNFDIENDKLGKYGYEICRWHHERYDGGGYPDKLIGDEIPLSAQVVSIADAYNSLTSKRIYKDKLSHKEAIAMIKNGKCGNFNPKIVQTLINIQEKILTKEVF